MRNGAQIKINSIDFMPAGKHQQQYLRTFVTNINGGNVAKIGLLDKAILDYAQESSGETPSEVTVPYIHDLVFQSSRGTPVALPVANSWDAEMASFIMEVECGMMGGMVPMKYYIAGYTDRPLERNDDAFINPDIKLIINSIFEVRYYTTPAGKESLTRGVQVLRNYEYNSADKEQKHRIRPSDIFAHMSAIKDPYLLANDITTFTDLRTIHSANPVYSDYTNADASLWLQHIVAANTFVYKQLQVLNKVVSRHSMDYIHAVYATLNDGHPGRNPITRAISKSEGAVTNIVKLGDLAYLDPEANNKCHVLHTPQMEEGVNYASWEGGDINTVRASMIAHGIPAIMAKYGIRLVEFEVANIYGQDEVKVIAAAGIDDFVKEEEMVAFEKEAKSRVFDLITQRNTTSITLTGRFDLFGNSKFTVSFDGEEDLNYFSPTFANSIFSPLIALDNNYLDHTTRQFDEAFSTLP